MRGSFVKQRSKEIWIKVLVPEEVWVGTMNILVREGWFEPLQNFCFNIQDTYLISFICRLVNAWWVWEVLQWKLLFSGTIHLDFSNSMVLELEYKHEKLFMPNCKCEMDGFLFLCKMNLNFGNKYWSVSLIIEFKFYEIKN